ncbi:3-deoxy-7-phosphoheptulonate synthase [Streptomyces rubiginosohelvolus]|uniref:3-deoxy-7-phosphoheptulonate synthase n=1 Tax=Streptomyces rubiginosohelvolus TaxID=67362 RepID=UPI0033D98ABD
MSTPDAALAQAPPLVFAGEVDQLRDRLAAVARGEALLLQAGNGSGAAAGLSASAVRGTLQTLLQMSAVLTYAASVPVVKVGRIAGHYPAPRTGDPGLPTRTYQAAASTLNLVRAFTTGGEADLSQVHAWNREFVTASPAGQRYEAVARGIDRALAFMKACGTDPAELRSVEFYAAHEVERLDYAAALTRTDSRTGASYATSGHLVRIGDGDRPPGEAHVGFAARIANPVAVRLGPAATVDEALGYVDRLDPDREPGRLTFAVRLGADRVRDLLPELVEKVTASGARPVWVTDPETSSGVPGFDDVLDEVRGFFEVHRSLGTHPGGIRTGLTGDGVTRDRERLLDLAFRVAEFARGQEPGARGCERQEALSATSSSPGNRASRSSRRSDM